jgi:lysozyme family protein
MVATNREASILKTLEYEGGYTNDKNDPGGPTNWGITIADARMYWKKNATAADVKAMPKMIAVNIYRDKYWAKMGCDDDPPGVDFATFDYGVNSGTGRAIPCRKANQNDDPVEWAKGICDDRLAFLKRLKTWPVFGKGWGSRVADVRATAITMAKFAQKPTPLPPPPDIPIPGPTVPIPGPWYIRLLNAIFGTKG